MTLYEIKRELQNGRTVFDLPLKVSYYARVSTEKEAQINSLENQVAFFEEYIQKNKNWTYAGGYVDEGISGTTSLKRENFMRMIDDGKNKKFDLIVAKEVSRFSRDTIDSLLYTRKLLEYDVCVYFLSDNIITASNDGELRLTIMSSMAQDEVRKISERTKFGFKRAIEKGTVLGTDNIWGYKKDNGKLVIDEKEAIIVRQIFERYANDSKIGLKKLSRELMEDGYLNRNQKPIHQNTLKNIIQNPKYKGYFTGGLSTVVDYRSKKRNFNEPEEWKIYKDYEKVPPIIQEDIWEKANQKLLSRSKNSKGDRKYQNKYALSAKIYCEKHHCAYVRRIKHYKNKSDEIQWVCGNYHNTGKKDCNEAYFMEKDIYHILSKVFRDYEKYKEEICKELMCVYSEILHEEKENNQEIEIQKEVNKLSGKQEKLLDLALEGILNKEELKAKKAIIEDKIRNLEQEIENLRQSKNKKKSIKQNINLLEIKIEQNTQITQKNIDYYIEEFLDKIVVLNESDIPQLQIVLNTKDLINVDISNNLRRLKNLSTQGATQIKKVPVCQNDAHR